MTLQSSGQIKFSDITAEFGQPSGKNIGAYRVSQNIGSLTNLPLDTGVPQSGQISFSNFHGKEANIIVDCHSSGSSNYNQDAYRNRFQNGNYNVVGGFRTSVPKSSWQGGKRVIININKTFSSSGASSRSHFALEVGRYNNNNSQHGWPTSTELSVVFGPNGYVRGKGGDGGRGGWTGDAGPGFNHNNFPRPLDGGEGTSGMKIHSGMSISGEGNDGNSRVIPGGGGGGGGLGGNSLDGGNDEGVPELRLPGGGGGGGAGTPAGSGGSTYSSINNYIQYYFTQPTSGSSGGSSSGGEGGEGAYAVLGMDEDEEVTSYGQAGDGGDGGNVGGNNGQSGGNGGNLVSGWGFDYDAEDLAYGGNGGYRYITY